MRRHVLVLAVALAVLPSAALAVPERSDVVSDPDVGRACAGAGAAHTSDVAVLHRTVAATWTIGRDSGIGLAVSQDDGRSWETRAVPFTTCTGGPLGAALDPDVALGADGAPWLSASGYLPDTAPAGVTTGEAEGQVLVAVGDAAPVSVFPGRTTERGFLETDPADSDTGWVLTWSSTRAFVTTPLGGRPVPPLPGPTSQLVIAKTDDRGRTWATTPLRTAAPGTLVVALGLVRTGGELVALSVEIDLRDPRTTQQGVASGFRNGRGPVAAHTSSDGGATWSEPVVVALAEQASLVDAAAGGGLVAVAAPQLDGALLVWTSEDAGRSWRQTTAATGVAQPATAVAVDDRGEVVALSYRATGSVLVPQLSRSLDSGRTFSAPTPLADPFDRDTVTSGSHVGPFGPYNGAAADGGDVLVAFVADDDRDGRTEARLARVR